MAVKTDWAAGDVLTAAQVNTYLANSGLVFVTSVEIPGGTTYVSVPSAFSATYDDYVIKVSGLNIATSGDLSIQFEDSGGTAVTTNYSLCGGYHNWASASYVGTTDTAWALPMITGYDNSFHVEIQDPFKAKYSWMQTQFCNNSRAYWLNGRHASATSYTRFRITASYTLSGSDAHVDVYGYRHP
jgi:hypothetical protein